MLDVMPIYLLSLVSRLRNQLRLWLKLDFKKFTTNMIITIHHDFLDIGSSSSSGSGSSSSDSSGSSSSWGNSHHNRESIYCVIYLHRMEALLNIHGSIEAQLNEKEICQRISREAYKGPPHNTEAQSMKTIFTRKGHKRNRLYIRR